MNCARRADHQSVSDGPQMVGVDVLSEASELGIVDYKVRGDASKGFGENQRRAAMQITHRLSRARLNGHRPTKEIVTPFGEFNAEMRGKQTHMAGASIIDRWNAEPDCHRYPTVAGAAGALLAIFFADAAIGLAKRNALTRDQRIRFFGGVNGGVEFDCLGTETHAIDRCRHDGGRRHRDV